MALNQGNNQPVGNEAGKSGVETGTIAKFRQLAVRSIMIAVLALAALAPALSARAGLAQKTSTPAERLEATGNRHASARAYQIPQPFAGWPAHNSPKPGLSRGDHAVAKGALLLAFALMASGVLGLWIYLARAYAGRVRRVL